MEKKKKVTFNPGLPYDSYLFIPFHIGNQYLKT